MKTMMLCVVLSFLGCVAPPVDRRSHALTPQQCSDQCCQAMTTEDCPEECHAGYGIDWTCPVPDMTAPPPDLTQPPPPVCPDQRCGLVRVLLTLHDVHLLPQPELTRIALVDANGAPISLAMPSSLAVHFTDLWPGGGVRFTPWQASLFAVEPGPVAVIGATASPGGVVDLTFIGY